MQPQERIHTLLKILLPLILLPVYLISPLPHRVQQDAVEARQAAEMGQYRLAAARLRDWVTREPWRVELWQQIGWREAQAGRLAEGTAALVEARAAGALDAEGWLLLGDLYHQRGEEPLALETWQAYLAQFGPRVEVYERIYRVQLARADYPAALAALHDWHAAQPRDAQVAYLYGVTLCLTDPDAARALLDEAARLDPAYAEPARALQQGIAQSILAERPGPYWSLIGRALARVERWDLALVVFQKAVEEDPQYAEGWAFWGEARFQNGADGKPQLDQAEKLSPNSTLVRALIALHWRRQDRLDLALPYLEAIAAQEPDEPTWQIELGELWALKGDLLKANDHFQQAVTLAPRSKAAWKALLLFSFQNNYLPREVGLPAARKLILIAPEDPESYDLMGWAMMYLGDTVSAERFLQQALETDSTFAPAYLHLGQLALQQDDLMQAYAYLKQADALGKNHSAGDLARRLLKQYFNEGGL